MKLPSQVKTKNVAVIVLVAILFTATLSYFAFAQSSASTFTISPGVYPGAPSYTIWAEDGNCFAKDASGLIVYSGSDAATVLTSALSSGDRIYVKGALTFSNTVIIDKSVEIVFESSTYITCNANPTFYITASNVKIRNGYFQSTIAGTQIFYITGSAGVEFDGLRFYAPYAIERNIKPFVINVTANYLDVKISNVFAETKYLFYIKKDPVAFVSRQNIMINNVVWKNGIANGICLEILADTHGLYNILVDNLYTYNTGLSVKITTQNNGYVAFCNFNNLNLQTPQGIYIYAPTGWISDIAFANVLLNPSGDNNFGIKCEGLIHSIFASNFRIQSGSGSGLVLVDLEPSSSYGQNGKNFVFNGLRIYDCVSGQTSIFANSNVAKSIIIGTNLYLEYANINGDIRIISPYTVNSGTATGTSPITVAHGLAGTPTTVTITPQGSTPYKVSYTADATNIYIYHDAGTSITVSWYAEYKP